MVCMSPILLPMVICGLGLVFSIVGTFFVRIKDEKSSVQNALNLGNWSAMILSVIAAYFAVTLMLPAGSMTLRSASFTKLDVFGAIVVGTIVGAIMRKTQRGRLRWPVTAAIFITQKASPMCRM